jgi:ABC-type multidrug transport system ATPase subunit
LNEVSFDVAPGEAVALWGPNGAGKTTLLRCLLGLLPHRGRVLVGGYDTRRQGKHARGRIGFVPQELHLHDNMSVWETLVFYARLKKAARPACSAVAARLGLTAQFKKNVGELSGGMKQRLALAVALLGDPPVLLLDEPTANLDLQSRDSFLRLLGELRDDGKTLIFCSHHLDEVVSSSERIVVLEEGRLRADCRPDELDRALGWEGFVWMDLSAEHLDRALQVLRRAGYAARRDHHGILVPVETPAKAAPINIVVGAGIPLRNFSYSLQKDPAGARPGEEEPGDD